MAEEWNEAASADEANEGLISQVVPTENAGDRLDRYVTQLLPNSSRTVVQTMIDRGDVLVDGVGRKANYRLSEGEQISVTLSAPASSELQPEAIPLDIVYEDDDVLVLNKPVGLVVHPAPGHTSGTLVNALLHHVPGIAVGGVDRPGLVHRLDKDTSGLLVVAKSDRGHLTLVRQWEARAVRKDYVALAIGDIEPDEGTIDAPIARDPKHRQKMTVIRGGRDAVTHFTVSERFGNATLADVSIDTGRTHQIRVHFAFIEHPIVGDKTYAPANAPTFGAQRQMLHAVRLGFALPGGRDVLFEQPLPDDFQLVVKRLQDGVASAG